MLHPAFLLKLQILVYLKNILYFKAYTGSSRLLVIKKIMVYKTEASTPVVGSHIMLSVSSMIIHSI